MFLRLSIICLFSANINNAFAQQKDSIYYYKQNLKGVKRVMIDGRFWVWTQKIGDGKIKVLLLHGGPGQTHEYFESFPKFLLRHGITVYFYDQFGSYFSQDPTEEQLNDTSIWKVRRYVEEIEQVRKSLSLGKFFIYGHSYGAVLALAYSIKYPGNIKGLIFSSMTPFQSQFAERQKQVGREIDSTLHTDRRFHSLVQNKMMNKPYDTAAYEKLFDSTFSRNYLLRLDHLPDEIVRTIKHKNNEVAQKIGPDVFTVDYTEPIKKLKVPVLVISGKYDFTTSPDQVKRLAKLFPKGGYVITPKGGHAAFLDDAKNYFPAIIKFLQKYY
ncbi:MAG: proline iminopeptidase-family hydrolase [Chitinophagaceae bacterium]|nr:proline iminopeptidase-family hydrolase [Chitinophagaceae bacterium]